MNTNKVDWSAEVQSAVLAMKEEGQKAYTFMKQEAPEVAAEYIRWQIVKGVCWSTPLAIGAAIGFALAVKSYRMWKKELAEIKRHYDQADWGAAVVFSCMFSLMLLAGAMSHASTAIKALIAPRIVILEGIKEVVK